jgi:hypothetical protein
MKGDINHETARKRKIFLDEFSRFNRFLMVFLLRIAEAFIILIAVISAYCVNFLKHWLPKKPF